ncbi:MAG: XRE family transcriptional regulator [Hyphomicrobium sp.]|uniref:helix-turn-helix domain-containing protein n=1 Tax=Hyphomicrobium sp. TaxID=82 RepID=UPI0025C39D6B|nr:XRE family transcriptional regulator [Hyphomicrobium sp.]MBX9861129.1 XRE family transcriptional regulator [Hyphomicrobium sp.]
MPPARPRTKQASAQKPLDSATQVAKLVGDSLRTIRRQQGHSLDTLARASGVSRAMLGQIETGKSAPTITLLWKVSKALGVPVAMLIAPQDEPSYQIERKDAARIVSAGNGRFEARPIAPTDDPAETAFKQLRIAPGHRERIAASRTATRISLVVGRGTLELTIGDEPPVRLAEGDAVFFSSTLKHVLSNTGPDESILYLVVSPQRTCRP